MSGDPDIVVPARAGYRISRVDDTRHTLSTPISTIGNVDARPSSRNSSTAEVSEHHGAPKHLSKNSSSSSSSRTTRAKTQEQKVNGDNRDFRLTGGSGIGCNRGDGAGAGRGGDSGRASEQTRSNVGRGENVPLDGARSGSEYAASPRATPYSADNSAGESSTHAPQVQRQQQGNQRNKDSRGPDIGNRQKARPANGVSAPLPSSSRADAAGGDDDRMQVPQANRSKLPGGSKSNFPRHPAAHHHHHQQQQHSQATRPAAPPNQSRLHHVDKTSADADAATISTTVGGNRRRDIHSRLGSPPRSPRNSLFRDESRSNDGISSLKRQQQQQRQQQKATRSDARSIAGNVTSPRGRGHREQGHAEQDTTDSSADGRGKPAGLLRRPSESYNAANSRSRAHSSSSSAARATVYPPESHDIAQHAVTSTRSTKPTSTSGLSALHAKGTCMTMCPRSEMMEREAEAGLSAFEATEETAALHFRRRKADPAKTVKKYRRSAAGRDMHSPDQLRPLSVLEQTAVYLVKEIFARACAEGDTSSSSPENQQHRKDEKGEIRGASSIATAYIFVEDRLRAVRQDLTVQGLGAMAESAAVLKLTANFYVIAGYLMLDQPTDVFDKHLHNRELQMVFASLADVFYQARGSRPQGSCPVPGEDEYLCLQAVHALTTAVADSTRGEAPLAEAACGKGVGRLFATTAAKLCAVSQSDAESKTRASSLVNSLPTPHSPSASGGGRSEERPPLIPSAVDHCGSFASAYPKMATALRVLSAVLAGNWAEFHRLLGRIFAGSSGECGGVLVGDESVESPFAIRLRCLSHGMLLPLRAHALRAFNKSFGKGEKIPLIYLRNTLRMRTDEHAAGLCRALSLPVENDENVVFKSVPARWKNDRARRTGFCWPPQPADTTTRASARDEPSSREDAWIGLEPQWLGMEATALSREVGPCQSCGGFGCEWCEDGEEAGSGEVEISTGLWDAALAPA